MSYSVVDFESSVSQRVSIVVIQIVVDDSYASLASPGGKPAGKNRKSCIWCSETEWVVGITALEPATAVRTIPM
jgi:hypothetical protein